MANDESFSALSQIIAQGLDYPDGGPKNSQIKAALDGLFESRVVGTKGLAPDVGRLPL